MTVSSRVSIVVHRGLHTQTENAKYRMDSCLAAQALSAKTRGDFPQWSKNTYVRLYVHRRAIWIKVLFAYPPKLILQARLTFFKSTRYTLVPCSCVSRFFSETLFLSFRDHEMKIRRCSFEIVSKSISHTCAYIFPRARKTEKKQATKKRNETERSSTRTRARKRCMHMYAYAYVCTVLCGIKWLMKVSERERKVQRGFQEVI